MALTAAELRAVYSVDEGPLDRSLRGLPGKVGGIRPPAVNIDGDPRGLNNAVDQGVGGAGRLSGAFRTAAGVIAGAFAFQQVGGFIRGAIDGASDLEGSVSKSSAIFGQNAAAIDQWARSAAGNLGLSRQQALASAAGFGDMFSQIGFAGTQAADMSQAVVQMSADLGAFNDLDTADVADRMSAAFRGEYDSLQALIPNINAARVEQEAMAATGKENADELTAQEKAAAVLAIVQKDGARAVGAFARESGSAAGAAKIATAQWEDQKAVIGAKLLPAFTALMGFLSGTVIPGIGQLVDALVQSAHWISENRQPILIVAGIIGAVLLPHLTRMAATSVWAWATSSAAAVKGAATSVASTYRAIGGFVAMGASAAASAARTVAAWVAAGARTAAALVAMAARFVAQGAVMAASAAATAARVVAGWVLMGAQAMIHAARMAAAWFIALGPIGWVTAAVIALVALIVANWDTVVSWTTTAWNAVTGAIAAAWDWITGIVTGAAAAVWGAVQAAWDWVTGSTVAAWNAVTGAIQAAWNWIIGIVSGALGAVAGVITGAWNSVVSATQTAFNSVVSAISGAISAGWNAIAALPGNVISLFRDAGSWLLSAGSDLVRGLWDGISGMAGWLWDKVSGWATGIVDDVLGFFGIGSPSKVFADMGKWLMRGMGLGIERHGDAAVAAALNAASAVTDAMATVQAPDLMAMADRQAMAGLTARRPTGAMPSTASQAGGADPMAGGIDKLLNVETLNLLEGTPTDLSRELALELRTRGGVG